MVSQIEEKYWYKGFQNAMPHQGTCFEAGSVRRDSLAV